VGNPYDPDELLTVVRLGNHGIATSSRMIRRWASGESVRHHLIDPRTGQPTDNGLDSVTVIAGDAWVAEILTKAAFVAGAEDGARLIKGVGAVGLLVAGLDRMVTAGPFTGFVEPSPVL
jgi:FAD:protein FMN transferase